MINKPGEASYLNYAKRLKDGATRKDVKVALIRLLYERGYSRDQVVQLFIIIDWMLQLPRALEPEFVQAVHAIQEERRFPGGNRPVGSA